MWLVAYFTRKQLCFYKVYSLSHIGPEFHLPQELSNISNLVETCLIFTLRWGLSYILFRCHHERIKFIKPCWSSYIFNHFTLNVNCYRQGLVANIKSMFIFKRASLNNSMQNNVLNSTPCLWWQCISQGVVKEIINICLE